MFKSKHAQSVETNFLNKFNSIKPEEIDECISYWNEETRKNLSLFLEAQQMKNPRAAYYWMLVNIFRDYETIGHKLKNGPLTKKDIRKILKH